MPKKKATKVWEEGEEVSQHIKGRVRKQWQQLQAMFDKAWPMFPSKTGLEEGCKLQFCTCKCCKILKSNKYSHILQSLGSISSDPEGQEIIIKCNLVV